MIISCLKGGMTIIHMAPWGSGIWAFIIWSITITILIIATTTTTAISTTITRLVLAGGKIMETKWCGPPLCGREGK